VTARIDAALSSAVERGDVPGVVGIAVNRDGVIYEGAFGKARVAENMDMRMDAIFGIFSMTKGLTSLAVLQQVDEGKLSLDEPAGAVHPKLKGVSVLAEDGGLRPAAKPVSLRHLLTHTSGFGYPFSSARLVQGLAAHEIVPIEADGAVNLRIPLLFDPGAQWQYGVSTDWAGELLEQTTDLTLPEYMDDRLFGPLGMSDTAFGVVEAKARRRPTVHTRQPDDSLTEGELSPPAWNRSGGGGLSSTASDYAKFLRFMLGDGTWGRTRLLSAEGMSGLCTDQIPGLIAGAWTTSAPAMSNDAEFSEEGTAGHSLGFIYSREAGPTGRSAGTLSWGGILNTYYWIDRAKGVAGATFAQILPFADERCLRMHAAFETAVYEAAGS
jgi:methyl acetate hydrolase